MKKFGKQIILNLLKGNKLVFFAATILFILPVGNMGKGYAQSYCTPTGDCSVTYKMYIDDIKIFIGSTYYLNQTATGCSSGGYASYTGTTVSFTTGTSYSWSIKSGTTAGYSNFVGIWIDFNDNGSFADPNEYLITGNGSGTAPNYSGSFTIPAGVAAGNHRMRARFVNGTQQSSSTACGASGELSETQDYTAVISVPCTNSSAATSVSASTSTICPGNSTTLSLAGGSLGTGANWQWYASSCGGGTSLGSGTSITVSPTVSTTYYVRAEGTCYTTTCASAAVTISTSTTCPGNIPWQITGSNVNFTGSVAAVNLSTTGALTAGTTSVSSLSSGGNINAGGLNITGTSTLTGVVTTSTLNAVHLNITGSTTFSQINASQSITVPTVIASRIKSGDTSGVHIGDSSMFFHTYPLYENMRASTTSHGVSIGTGAQANGALSIGIGYDSRASGPYSLAFGNYVQTSTSANNAIAIGSGIVGTYPSGLMVNNTPNSLAVGFKSNVPTLFVTGGNGTTNSAGKVGIGYDVLSNSNQNSNPVPYKTLTVYGDASIANYNARTNSNNNHNDGLTAIEILGNDQVPVRRGLTVDNDPMGDMNFYINSSQQAGTTEFNFKNGAVPNNSSNYGTGLATPNLMSLNSNGNLTLNSIGTTSPFTITNGGTNVFQIGSDGRIHLGIRTTNSNHLNALLTVYGEIISQAVYVTNNAWSDFVFDKTYQLMPLREVEKFYTANHHLPNVPSEKEIMQNGNNIAETDAILLQKVEELTLYLVQQQKEIEALKKQNEILTEKINGKK